MSYTVFKNYGFADEQLIAQFDDLEIACARAEQDAEISFTDEVLEVATFSESGEYITHFKTLGAVVRSKDSEDDDDDILIDDDSWYWDWNSPFSYHHY